MFSMLSLSSCIAQQQQAELDEIDIDLDQLLDMDDDDTRRRWLKVSFNNLNTIFDIL